MYIPGLSPHSPLQMVIVLVSRPLDNFPMTSVFTKSYISEIKWKTNAMTE